MRDVPNVADMLKEAIEVAGDVNFSNNGARGEGPRTIEEDYHIFLDDRCFQCDILYGLWQTAREDVLKERRNGNKALVLSVEEIEHAKRLVIKKLANPPTPREPRKAWPESLDHWGTCPDLGED